ncbi:hypothetical protein H4R35_003714 [Dimargaris xerosporica]|nr:hypothetical protein H4R35_003714 [Dimargaris xerosporica]
MTDPHLTSSSRSTDVQTTDTDDSRDPAYFQYYGQMQHQQNMLQDYVRTSAYQTAIVQNGPSVFKDKLVLDVGAGSGILSFFAVQAGAAKVYAVEASDMARNIQLLLDAAKPDRLQPKNPWLHNKVEVRNAKMEDPSLNIPAVDVIISEPIGVLLVHERMLESFLYARDNYLKPGGTILPSQGVIHLAPFTDSTLWTETMTKVRFWEQQAFYGVDWTALFPIGLNEYFRMPVVGYFDPKSLIARPTADGYNVDFTSITVDDLKRFTIPFYWMCEYTGIMHGIAGWFDLKFCPPSALHGTVNTSMSTSPDAPRTHWQQVRFLLQEPLAVNANQIIMGHMHCTVNDKRSYDLVVELSLCPIGTQPSDSVPADAVTRRGMWLLHEQTYNYSYNPTPGQEFFPEYAGLYTQDMSAMNLPGSLVPPLVDSPSIVTVPTDTEAAFDSMAEDLN